MFWQVADARVAEEALLGRVREALGAKNVIRVCSSYDLVRAHQLPLHCHTPPCTSTLIRLPVPRAEALAGGSYMVLISPKSGCPHIYIFQS